MEIIRSVARMQGKALGWRKQGLDVGLVPTMGALHEGHLALVREALRRAERVIVSIFVNPLQFGPSEDYGSYPRDLENDARKLEGLGVHCLFAPTPQDMYTPGFQTKVSVSGLTKHLCGLYRPGHFDGVTTVVLKLFNICQPTFAVFGEKDYQQLKVIERMVSDLNLPVEVVRHPTVREGDGLAMSSRNAYLDESQRVVARAIYRTLSDLAARIRAGEVNARALVREGRRALQEAGLRVQYLAICDPDTLEDTQEIGDRVLIATAAFVGNGRLIDNTLVHRSGQKEGGAQGENFGAQEMEDR